MNNSDAEVSNSRGNGGVGTGSTGGLCPMCDARIVVESRGSDFFAWCPGHVDDGTGGLWRSGCSSVDGFGDTRASAVDAALAYYLSI